jgi:hypothetical protein
MLTVIRPLHGFKDPLQVTEPLVPALSQVHDLLHLVAEGGHDELGQAGPQAGEFEVRTHLARDEDLQELVPLNLRRVRELALAIALRQIEEVPDRAMDMCLKTLRSGILQRGTCVDKRSFCDLGFLGHKSPMVS